MGKFEAFSVLGGPSTHVSNSNMLTGGTSMKKNIVWLVLVLFSSVVAHAIPAQCAPNQLQEIYFQKNHDQQKHVDHCLEVGYTLLLFGREVEKSAFMPRRNTLSNGMHQLVFTFNNAYTGYNTYKKFKECCSDGYTITLKPHDKSLVLIVTYDPHIIDVRYDSYTDLDLRKGFIVRFYDAHLLRHMNNKESYILQTAAIEFLSVYV